MFTTTITTDVKVFEQMNVPTFGNPTMINFYIPTMLEFGKTYYRERNGKLVAFKVYAYSFCRPSKNSQVLNHDGKIGFKIAYYVQYANTDLRWEINTLDYNCFESKEDYFDHINGIGNRVIDWCWDGFFNFVQKCEGMFIAPPYTVNPSMSFKKRYMWDNIDGKPNACDAYIEYALFSSSGVIFCLNHKKNCCGEPCNGFATYEECANDHINGMVVVDFEECSFNLNIEIKVVQPTTSVIRVVEVK